MSTYSEEEIDRLLLCIKEGTNDEAKSLFLQLRIPYDLTDNGRTFLHHSAMHGNTAMIQHLIDVGCNINVENSHGFTPLMLAVKLEEVASVEVLLKNNADIYLPNRYGEDSFQVAVHCCLHDNYSAYIKDESHLISDMFFDKINNDFSTNKRTLTPFLLNADVLMKLAVVACGSVELSRFMLENNYPLNLQEPARRRTAFHYAIMFAKIENAKLLIEHGANTNLLDTKGCSPLCYYAWNFQRVDEKSEVLKTLMKASWTVSNRRDRKKVQLKEIEHLLMRGNKETVRTVLVRDVNVASMNFSEGRSLLYLLMQNDNVDVLDLFAELDIKFDVNKHSGRALAPAVSSGCLRKVEFILNHGGGANADVTLLYTVMSSSFGRKNKLENEKVYAKITEVLIQHGADAQFAMDNGNTFVDHIRYFNNTLPTKVIIAHLALIGTFDQSPLTDDSRDKIQSDPELKAHFDMCTQQIEDMKNVEVYGTLTLFKLLTEREDKLVIYARNQEFILAFNSIMENVSNMESYYFSTLQKRIAKALEKVELDKKAAAAIEVLTGLSSDTYPIIVSKIINFLNIEDLNNLCKVESFIL